MAETSGTRSYRFFILFFIFTLAFSLTSAGILKGNMAISMDAYATKSDGSSGGGDSSDGGGESKGGDSCDGSGEGGGSSGGGSSGGSNGNGGSGSETGGNDNPTTEEPSTPPPSIEEPPPTVGSPPPPPPVTCEQGSTSTECFNVPEPPPPPPPGPIDCSTTPNDPSCKTTPGGPIDFNTNPNDPSCGPQPPVDCKTNPDDPSCTTPPPIDCKANPNDASCTTPPVDCTIAPNDPSCKPDCTKNPDDPSCKVPCDPNTENCPPPPVDCTKNPDDPSCKVDCTTNPDDPSCPPTPPCQPAVIGISCPPPPPPPPVCKLGEHLDPKANKCVPNIQCKNGEYDPIQKRCVPCPTGTKLLDGKCQEIINITIVVHKVVKNSFITNNPTFLLLLDTAQLCQLAGDTQCVAKQNQFDTLNLVTKLDSTGKTWTITGQVENRAVSKTQNNVQVIAYFYDSKGNNVGGPYKGTVNPIVLKSLQLGAFTMKPSMSIMKGTPTFIRLEYQSTTPRP
ncbi:MAG: hypothetical protein ACJ72Q_09500 [Nitrososphaeraceae archaeon]